jgi:hypothetical protein
MSRLILVEMEGSVKSLGGIDGFEEFLSQLAKRALSPWLGKYIRAIEPSPEAQQFWTLVALGNGAAIESKTLDIKEPR